MAWYSGKVTQSCSKGYYCDGSVENGLEGGVDISTPYGTPVTAVTAGKVVGSGWYWGGGVVTVRGHVPFFNTDMDVYYQHLIDIKVKNGQAISVGQLLGHTRTWIEFGCNPGNWPGKQGWGGIWGPLPHPGRSINPDKSGWLASIKSGKVTTPTQTSASAASTQTADISTGLGAGIAVGLLGLVALAVVGIVVFIIFAM